MRKAFIQKLTFLFGGLILVFSTNVEKYRVTTDGFGRVTGVTSARYELASETQEGVVKLSPDVFDVVSGFTTLATTVFADNITASGIITAQTFSGNFENVGGNGSIDVTILPQKNTV